MEEGAKDGLVLGLSEGLMEGGDVVGIGDVDRGQIIGGVVGLVVVPSSRAYSF